MITFSEFFEFSCSMFSCEWLIMPHSPFLPFANDEQPLIGYAHPLHMPVISIVDSWVLPAVDFSKSALIILATEKQTSRFHAGTPVLAISAKPHEIMESLLPWCQKHLRLATPYHGVFMDIFGKGVLITGAPKSGKSECALALLAKKHRLIADDIVYFYQASARKLIGYADKAGAGLLAIRDIGIIDVRQQFGPLSTVTEKPLDLIIALTSTPQLAETIISNVCVPTLSLSLAFKPDLAMLIESAVQFALSQRSTVIENLLTLPAMVSTESTS